MFRNPFRKRLTGGDLLYYLAEHAVRDYGLKVWQYDNTKWGPASPGSHSPTSYHYRHDSKGRGRAFDAYGPERAMSRFAAVVERHHLKDLSELIHNPNASVKNGRKVSPEYWGNQTWSNHTNHVHVAI